MKAIIFLILLTCWSNAFASSLTGTWTYCEKMSNGKDLERSIAFEADNTKIEYFAIYSKNDLPCRGDLEIAAARTWKITLKGNRIHSTLVSSSVAPVSDEFVEYLNKTKVCNNRKWKKEINFNCEADETGLFVTKFGKINKGDKQESTYRVVKDDIFIITNNKTIIYKNISTGPKKKIQWDIVIPYAPRDL